MNRTLMCTTLAAFLAAPAFAATGDTASFCDRGFHSVDSNNDGMISADEDKALRDARFQGLDADGDGAVSRDEFANCDQKMRADRTAAPADPDGAFDTIDADKSGSVSTGEYYDAARGARDKALKDKTNATDGWSDPYYARREGDDTAGMSDEEYFSGVGATHAMTDANRDGEISREEYSARGHNAYDGSTADGTFDRIDANRDDKIDRSEFDAASDESRRQAEDAADRDGYYDASKGAPAAYLYMFAM